MPVAFDEKRQSSYFVPARVTQRSEPVDEIIRFDDIS